MSKQLLSNQNALKLLIIFIITTCLGAASGFPFDKVEDSIPESSNEMMNCSSGKAAGQASFQTSPLHKYDIVMLTSMDYYEQFLTCDEGVLMVSISNNELRKHWVCTLPYVPLQDRSHRFITKDHNFVFFRCSSPTLAGQNNIELVEQNFDGKILKIDLVYLKGISSQLRERIIWSFSQTGDKMLCYSGFRFLKLVKEINAKYSYDFDTGFCLFDLSKRSEGIITKKDIWFYGDIESYPLLSPDGSKVCFNSKETYKDGKTESFSDNDFVIIDMNEPEKYSILKTTFNFPKIKSNKVFTKCWSPDSSRILCLHNPKSGKFQLSSIGILNGDISDIDTIDLEKPYPDMELEWSDSGIIVNTTKTVYVKTLQMSNLFRIPIPKNITKIKNARLSPDGDKVLFIGKDDDENICWIFVYMINSSSLLKSPISGEGESIDIHQAVWINKKGCSMFTNKPLYPPFGW